MKRFLCAGEGYAFLVLILLWWQSPANAYSINYWQPSNNSHELKIGDSIPDVLWNKTFKVFNHPKAASTIKLSDYKGKLIILDFWATWCTVCLSEFPEIQRINSEYNDNVQILLVNPSESKEQIENKFAILSSKNKSFVIPELPIIYEQNELNNYFPYFQLPHHIWISPEGFVIAITYGDNTTLSNVKEYLINKSIKFEEKKKKVNPKSLIPFTEDKSKISDSSYFIFSPYNPEFVSFSQLLFDEKSNPNRLLLINQSLLQLFSTAYGETLEFRSYNKYFRRSTIVLEVADKSIFNSPDILSEYRNWRTNNNYCIEVYSHYSDSLSVFDILKDKLNSLFPYNVKQVKKKVEAWVIKIDTVKDKICIDTNKIHFKSPKRFNQKEVSHLFSYLNTVFRSHEVPFVVDIPEDHKVSITLEMDIQDPEEWINLFAMQGYILRKEIREIPHLLIQDKDKLEYEI